MISVRFSCDKCGMTDVIALVRARRRDENIIEWMENVVIRAAANQHHMIQPSCRPKSLKNLKIPFDNESPDAYLGGQTNNIPPAGDTTSAK